MNQLFQAEQCPQCGGELPLERCERIVCPFCGSTLVRIGLAQARAAHEDATLGWGVCLKRVVCADQRGLGGEVFEMLLPAEWQHEGGVFWNPQNPAMPATIAFRTANPRGTEAIELLPSFTCFWTNNPLIRGMGMMGQPYMGSEVREPAPAARVLSEVVVPRYRGRCSGLEVLQCEAMPDLVAMLGQENHADGSVSDGGRIRIRYRFQNTEYEEDIFGLVKTTPLAGGMFSRDIFWVVEGLFAFRAEAGRLDQRVNCFMASIRSFQLKPDWFKRYHGYIQQLTRQKVAEINQIGRMSRMTSSISNSLADRYSRISRTLDETSDMITSGYEHRQAIMDDTADAYSRAIRGVDEYYDPMDQMPVELPGGYDNAWSDGLGNYIVSDVAGFNPNIGDNHRWEAMPRGR